MLLESTGISGKPSKQSSTSSAIRNPFRYAAKNAGTPWAKDMEGGPRAGSAEKNQGPIGVLEREINSSEELEFGCEKGSKA